LPLSPVKIARKGGLAILTIANPPVNVLSIGRGVVAALHEALVAAAADPAVKVIILAGEGRDFCAGADISDFDQAPEKVDRLRDLFLVIDRSVTPVVAVLHGNVLGGGLELALAAHYRVAAPGTKIGLPEVKLGLLPGGGGTQRLPRLIGVERALDMMLTGTSISAEAAFEGGLVDAIGKGDTALEWALARAGEAQGGGFCAPAVPDEAAIAVRRTEIARRPDLGSARAFIVDCVEAATQLDLDQGLLFERDRFGQLLLSDASHGLRHAFFAERAVARQARSGSGLDLPALVRVAVIGGGTMGSGIALALLGADVAVTLIEPNEAALAAGQARIAGAIERDVAKGRLSADSATSRKALLSTASSIDDAAGADIVIEAVFEDLDVKRSVFEQLDRIAAPDAILATNTSALDIDRIAEATTRPDRIVGLHFFSPANIMRLVEVVRGAATSEATLVGARALVQRIGKVGVVAGNCDGFIGNRIFEEYLRQAYWLLEEGALPAQVDGAMERWGMAMGPLRTMDLAGQDIGWSIRKRRAVSQPGRPYSKIPDLICEMGRFGQKTGAGYYRYADGRTAVADPEIDDLIVRYCASQGIVRRPVSDDEIVERCVLAMINEGARIIGEGMAARPLDVDVVELNGYGFPAERGGPMFYADRLGLGHVRDRLLAFGAGREGWAWQPAPLIGQMLESGDNFSALNG